MKPNLISAWLSLATAIALATFPITTRGQSASASISGVAAGGGSFDYTITLTNTGSVALNSFWYGWTTDGNNLPSDPSGAGNSLGWDNDLDANSIMFKNSAGTALAPGHSATFTFVSTDSPGAITAGHSGESVVYVGAIDFSQATPGDSSPVFSPVLVSGAVSNSAPGIIDQPQSQTVLTNSTVTFSVTASNATFYQWQSNLVDLPGQTNDTLVLSNVVVADSATYGVIVSNSSESITSSNAVLTVLSIALPFISTQPQSQTALTNTTVTFSVTASNAAFYQWQSNMIGIAGETNASLILSNVVIGDSADYQVVVSNASGAITSDAAALLVGFPANIIAQPASVSVSAGTPVTLQAQAAGSPAPQYQWMFDNSRLAGQTNADLVLEAAITANAGTYSVVVSNIFGAQTSSNAIVTVSPLTSVIEEKLVVTIDPPGAGSVSPNLNGKSLIVAKSYTVTAKAARGQAFASWSGIVQSDDPTLTFVMPSVSNAILTAHFIPSPFASNDVAGLYSGLFFDANNPSNDTSGYFSATLTASGLLDGQVKIAGASATFSTLLRADGSGSVELKPRGQSALDLTVQVDLGGSGTLTGTIADTNNTFLSQLTARRGAFSASHPAASYKGYYTWAMPGATGDAPAGYSYGAATVAASGGVQLSLNLSDGTAASASASLSDSGQMPLYVSLYGGKGSFLSWVSFTNTSGALSTNGAYWFKASDPSPNDYGYGNPTPAPAQKPYPDGFTLTNLSLSTAVYVAEGRGTNALDANSVSIQFSAADLTTNIADTIALRSNGAGGTSPGPTVNITDKTGLFTGTFVNPVSGKTVHFKGAVLSPGPAGYGYFISDDLSGSVLIEP